MSQPHELAPETARLHLPDWSAVTEVPVAGHAPASPADFAVSPNGNTEAATHADTTAVEQQPELTTIPEEARLIAYLPNGNRLVRVDRGGKSLQVQWNGKAGYLLDTREYLDPTTGIPLSLSLPTVSAPPSMQLARMPSIHPLTSPGDHHVEYGKDGGEQYVHIRAVDDDEGDDALHGALVSGLNDLRAKLGAPPLDIHALAVPRLFSAVDVDPTYGDENGYGHSAQQQGSEGSGLGKFMDDQEYGDEYDDDVYLAAKRQRNKARVRSILVGSAWFIGLTFIADNAGYIPARIANDGLKGAVSDVVHAKSPFQARLNPLIGVMDSGKFVWKHTLGG